MNPMNMKVRVAVVLFKENKILLVKHSKDGRSYWVLPGGTVEKGETVKETAIREIKEETNFGIVIDNLLFVSAAIPDTGGRHIIDFCFSGKIVSGKLKVAEDEKVLQEGKFFDLAAFETLEFYPDIKKEIKKIWEGKSSVENKYLGNRWQ